MLSEYQRYPKGVYPYVEEGNQKVRYRTITLQKNRRQNLCCQRYIGVLAGNRAQIIERHRLAIESMSFFAFLRKKKYNNTL